ncbi:MAG: hypothetical protein RIS88_2848 [Pseudomonadota bacterium]|jgi:hypothetical protein
MITPEALCGRFLLKGAHPAARQSRFRGCLRKNPSPDLEHA